MNEEAMFLMTVNTFGYVAITLIFAIFFLSAYLYRRKNLVADDFLGSGNKSNSQHLGLLEFIVLTTLSAKFGISGFYYAAIAIIFAHFICCQHQVKLKAKVALVIFIFQFLVYLGLICFTIVVAAKIFQYLLGWSFVHSIPGLFGFSLICLLVGGNKALDVNRIVGNIIFMLIILIGLGSILLKTSVSQIITNLQQLAKLQGYSVDFYTGFIWNGMYLTILIISAVSLNILAGRLGALRYCKKNISGILIKIFVVAALVLLGVTTIATNADSSMVGDKQIITYQAQLSDGEIGYIVKAIDNKTAIQKNIVPGILPPLINDKTNQIEVGVYDYTLSGIVVLQHYLLPQLNFLVVLAIMVLFILSVDYYLLCGSKIMVKCIVEPWGILAKYSDSSGISTLWFARTVIIGMAFLALTISYFMLPYFSLLNWFSLVFAIFLAPICVIVIVLLLIKNNE